MPSSRIKNLRPSAPQAINKLVLELKSQGRDIISFGIGEPNFDVPDEAKRAAAEAIEKNFSRYTPSDGIPELKRAVIEKLKKENNVEYEEKNIIVGAGAKQCLFNVFQTLLNEGDEVIVPSPYWLSYPEQIRLSGGVPVFVDTSPGFRLKAETILPAISAKTKAIVINSPNNPSGMMIEKEELWKIAELAVEKNIFVISDEVYEYFTYGAEHASIASLNGEIKKITITINGLSKSAGMTGWRLGYAAGPEEVIAGMRKLQEQITSNPSSIAQKAGVAALFLGKGWMAEILDDFKKKRDFVCLSLGKMGISVVPPDGAFYIFFDVSKYFGPAIRNSDDFCRDLLERAGVALVPGGAFGNDNCARLSYATTMENLKNGLERIRIYF